MRTSTPSICRTCNNMCAVIAQVEDGRLVGITGDRENSVFAGYTCVKGRAQPELYNHPDRLLHSLKRQPDGSFAPMPVDAVMDEVAERLTTIVDRHGPRAVAGYFGTYVIANPSTHPMFAAFMNAIGSPMVFSPNTLDKPGKSLAKAMLGTWMAPPQGYDRPDAALLMGLNPFVSYYGTACGHPGKWLSEQLARGMQVVVIDPRVSDVARRATIHLQPRPGEDPAIIAGLIHIILAERLEDNEFLEQNADGLDQLRDAVAPFTPTAVAERADVPVDDLIAAARTIAGARRGYCAAGVGPNMSSSSTLVEYLLLVLDTICGHWLRAGETVLRAPTLLPGPVPKAQAAGPSPAYGLGHEMRVLGLGLSRAGLPTGVLPDEILLPGEGQVRALVSCGGSPVGAWPDQLKTIAALDSLELLIQFDPWMSPTARRAHYVVAPRMAYEVMGATTLTDALILQPTWYGPAVSYAQFTDVIVEPPPGSEVIQEAEFFFGVAQRMGLQLELGAYLLDEVAPKLIDMTRPPTSREILDHLTDGGRVSLDDVRQHPHGAEFPEPAVVVQPKDDGWTGRLDLANADMMGDLAVIAGDRDGDGTPDDYPFRLLCRRMQQSYNSSMKAGAMPEERPYNPAFMNPDDLADLGVGAGDSVIIRSARASIPAVVAPDATLRRGLVSMAHGFGDGPDRDHEFRQIGSCTSRLLDNLDLADRYVGMPRMSNIPVAVDAIDDGVVTVRSA